MILQAKPIKCESRPHLQTLLYTAAVILGSKPSVNLQIKLESCACHYQRVSISHLGTSSVNREMTISCLMCRLYTFPKDDQI
jgi:hypothetical protein